MDAKITKKRLSNFLSYDWLKIVGIAVALIFFWYLVLTMTSTRITNSQEFIVYNYTYNNALGNKFHTHYSSALQNDLLSFEIIEAKYDDLSANVEYADTKLQSYLQSGMGDLMLIPNADNPSAAYKDDEGNDAYLSYAETFLLSYGVYVSTLENENGYFTTIERYLNDYFHGDYATGELDEAKADADFVTRVKTTKDKRFKTNEQIESGKKYERARLTKYRNALLQFYGYVDAGYVQLTDLSTRRTAEDTYAFEGKYAINLCPSENENEGYFSAYSKALCDIVSYSVTTTSTVTDENGEEKEQTETVKTAKDMCVLFFNFSPEYGFSCESLLYVNSLIAECLRVAEIA